MRTTRYQTYFDDEILTAEPLQLIQLLYRSALDSITAARRHLILGDIRARSRAISKAMAMVTELSLSLDHSVGGDLSKNLAALYAYAARLLIRANFDQSDAPLAQAEHILSTLFEGWQNCTPSDETRAESNRIPAEPVSYQPVSCAY